MKISLDDSGDAYLIQGYAPGEIRVLRPACDAFGEGLAVCHASLIVSAARLITDWAPQHFDELATSHFEVLKEIDPEVLLIGTGPRLRLPSPPLLAPLVRLRAGFEVMDTPAACRTYNLLVGEGRRVAAALIIGG